MKPKFIHCDAGFISLNHITWVDVDYLSPTGAGMTADIHLEGGSVARIVGENEIKDFLRWLDRFTEMTDSEDLDSLDENK